MRTPRSILPKALRRTGKRRLYWTLTKTVRSPGRISKSLQARRHRWTAERLQRLARQEAKR